VDTNAATGTGAYTLQAIPAILHSTAVTDYATNEVISITPPAGFQFDPAAVAILAHPSGEGLDLGAGMGGDATCGATAGSSRDATSIKFTVFTYTGRTKTLRFQVSLCVPSLAMRASRLRHTGYLEQQHRRRHTVGQGNRDHGRLRRYITRHKQRLWRMLVQTFRSRSPRSMRVEICLGHLIHLVVSAQQTT